MSPQSIGKSVAATAAARLLGLTSEHGLHPINGHGRNGTVLQTVVNAINFGSLAGQNTGGLDILRSLSASVQNFLTELGDLVVLRVDLVLAKLILDGLHTGRQSGQNVAGVVCVAVANVAKAGLHTVKTGSVRGLLCKAAVQGGNLVVVKLVGNSVLCAGDCRSSSRKAGTQGVLDARRGVSNAHLHVAAAATKLGGKIAHAVADAGHAVMQLGVSETIGHVVVDPILTVEQPGEVIAEAAGKAAAKATHAPAAITGQQED